MWRGRSSRTVRRRRVVRRGRSSSRRRESSPPGPTLQWGDMVLTPWLPLPAGEGERSTEARWVEGHLPRLTLPFTILFTHLVLSDLRSPAPTLNPRLPDAPPARSAGGADAVGWGSAGASTPSYS